MYGTLILFLWADGCIDVLYRLYDKYALKTAWEGLGLKQKLSFFAENGLENIRKLLGNVGL